MFLDVNMFLALLRTHFSPRLRRGLKLAWVGPKTYLRPRTSTLLLYYIVFTDLYSNHEETVTLPDNDGSIIKTSNSISFNFSAEVFR